MAAPRVLARPAVAVSAAMACYLVTASALAGDHHVVAESSAIVAHHLVRTESTVQVGDDPVNRFTMVRVAKDGPPQAVRGTLLLLPPVSNGFVNYEATASGDYADSFAAYFAARGYEVWGLGQRTEGLVAGDCEGGGVDCSAMAGWGLDALLDDARFVRGRMVAAHPGMRPVVGGVSLGSMAGMALIDADPDDYAGALLMEGSLYDDDPGVRAVTGSFCAQYGALLAQGVYYDDQQLPGLKGIAYLATVDPSGPSPVPGVPPGFTNHQVYVALMNAPGITPLTPRPGYAFLAGDPVQDRFFYADDALARANMATFSDYTSLPLVRDIECSLAGDRTYTGHLDRFQGPVFVVGGGRGFGPGLLDAAALMTHASPTIHFVAEYGHMDAFFNVRLKHVVEQPIAAWLDTDVFHR